MTPEYVADHAIDAILRELRVAVVPKIHYVLYALKGYGSRIRYRLKSLDSGYFLGRCSHVD